MGCFTTWDPGNCGCAAPSCFPCALPAMNLTCTHVINPGRAGAGTYPFTLTYAAGAVDTWSGCLAVASFGGTQSLRFTLGCKAGVCTYVNVTYYSNNSCGGTAFPTYDWNSGTSGGGSCLGIDTSTVGGVNLNLTSGCAPLNLLWAPTTLVDRSFRVTP